MAMEPLHLGFGDAAIDAALMSSLWAFQDDLQPQENMEELKQSLMATTLELEAAKEELRRKEQSIAKLADLVRQVAKERDDARDQLQQLLAAAAAKPPAPALVTSSVTDSDCSLVSSPVDPFFDPVTSSDKRCKISSPPPAARQQCHAAGAGAGADAVLDMLAMKKPLPQRGRLLQSVMEAGPLLQNLLVAGLLPRWRNPPPVSLDTLPVGVRGGGGYAGASLAPPINSAPVLGYGGTNACTKRPMSAMSTPAMAMAATSCSPGFSAKRHRPH
ncbi:hypothetical protein GUJ93_ZPchr0010g9296 [Zizania palustris]|uniref:Uncharacterized protein n=1 Tax=Zizania palustris TaxID=103762 RepID=A0A8J5W7L8_ZIZPA|nr:hypothetical protein GUJ93_ZPchr0010g9296 [Zizania palustris]